MVAVLAKLPPEQQGSEFPQLQPGCNRHWKQQESDTPAESHCSPFSMTPLPQTEVPLINSTGTTREETKITM
jgi:hypothetical protein